MDEELLSLEGELMRLRPAVPSRGLTARVAAELAPRSGIRRIGFLWLALPAAACAAIAFFSPGRDRDLGPPRSAIAGSAPQPPAAAARIAAAPAFKPVEGEDLLLGTQDAGFVALGDGTAARGVRELHVDTVRWEDPSTHASVSCSVPREEFHVVPVSFQ